MTCWLFQTKPLLEPMLVLSSGPLCTHSYEVFSQYSNFHPRKHIRKYHVEYGSHCVRPSYINDFQLNTFSLWQNCCHFTNNIFKCIFVNENVWISLKMSLKFVPKFRINSIPALAQIWIGTNQVTSYYLNQWWLLFWGTYVSLSLNELRKTKNLQLVDWRN